MISITELGALRRGTAQLLFRRDGAPQVKLIEGRGDVLGVRRGVLNFLEPGLAVGCVVDHQILARSLAAEFIRIALLTCRPRKDLDRHRVGLGVVTDHRF